MPLAKAAHNLADDHVYCRVHQRVEHGTRAASTGVVHTSPSVDSPGGAAPHGDACAVEVSARGSAAALRAPQHTCHLTAPLALPVRYSQMVAAAIDILASAPKASPPA